MQQIQIQNRPKGPDVHDVIEEHDDSEILLNVPSEIARGQMGVQDARASREHKKLRQQVSSKPTSSSKTGRENAKQSRMDTSVRTRSSSHNMKSSNKRASANTGNHDRRNNPAKAHEK